MDALFKAARPDLFIPPPLKDSPEKSWSGVHIRAFSTFPQELRTRRPLSPF